jgi:hypothetical protein
VSVPVAADASRQLATTGNDQVARPKVTRISVARRPGYVWGYLWVRYASDMNVYDLATQGRLINLEHGYGRTREEAIELARASLTGFLEMDTRHVAECLRREISEHERFSKHIEWVEDFLDSRRPSPGDESAAEAEAPGGAPNTEVFTVEECRRQMQKHHPDKGGNAEQFHLWKQRFEEAKAREHGA